MPEMGPNNQTDVVAPEDRPVEGRYESLGSMISARTHFFHDRSAASYLKAKSETDRYKVNEVGQAAGEEYSLDASHGHCEGDEAARAHGRSELVCIGGYHS